MSVRYLSAAWAAVAPALGNHLWQSTLFLLLAGFLTLVLRNNYARTRYALWLTASVKFLIPFSLLAVIGSHLTAPRPTSAPDAALYVTIQQIGLPFSVPAISAQPQTAAVTRFSSLTHLLLPALLAVWLSGFLAVCFAWYLRWRRVSALVRLAVPMREGRELAILREVEAAMGMPTRTKLLLSRASLEPGIFGIAAPVMIWPQGISERLDDAHVEAILTHELWHVRHRDNLTATIHMLVEALFWFHPLVWWLGGRLVEERERACDEAVLASGRDCRMYAESILKICEFCVESSLPCVSGVTGSDLKKRVVRIMSERVARKLDFSKKLLLTTVGSLALALPIFTGLLSGTESRAASTSPAWRETEGRLAFEVASVKQNTSGSESSTMNVPLGPGDIYPPNGGVLSATNVSLISFIYFAYNLSGTQFQLILPHLPDWVIKDRFDIQAEARGNPTKNQMRLMMQTLLADRFKLSAHYEKQQLPVLALVLATPGKTGPQLQPHQDDPPCSTTGPQFASKSQSPAILPDGLPADCSDIVGLPSSSGHHRVGARNVSMALLANWLPQMGNLDRAVVDKTGLSGNFDLKFDWQPQLPSSPAPSPQQSRLPEPRTDFLEDLKEQLGLKLESQTGPVPLLVIDHVEKLLEN
jgi:uncharacterized protein (TIGR03435 family)